MPNILTKTASKYKDAGTSKLKSLNPIKGLSKSDKKAAVNPAPEDVTLFYKTVMSEAVMKHPTFDAKAVPTPADFYRRGGPSISPRLLGDPTEETPASIRLIGKPNRQSNSKDVDLVPPYTKFFLENVQEGHAERHQIVETFGEFYVFFFGERPPIYNYSGTLLNADNVNWVEDFFFYYDNFLRGTKCVEANAKIVLTYGFRQVEGFLLSTNFQINAASERGVPFSFQLLIIDRKLMKLSRDFGLIEADGKFNSDKSILQMLKTGTSDGCVSKAYGDAKKVANGKAPAAKTLMQKVGDATGLTKIFSKTKLATNAVTGGLKRV